MKPVFQKTIDAGRGDCFSACLASLLEIPLDRVPNFRQEENETGIRMMELARRWLAEHYALSIISIYMAKKIECGDDVRIAGAVPGTPCIASGKSPNIPNGQHAVVGRLDEHGLNFEMTHDPNPSGKGILGSPEWLYFLVPLFPQKSSLPRKFCKNYQKYLYAGF